MNFDYVNWQAELANLVASARTPEDKAATEAFAKALGPYLERPELLRTLLGKIQAPIPGDALAVVVAQRKFDTLDEVKSKLPKEIDVISV